MGWCSKHCPPEGGSGRAVAVAVGLAAGGAIYEDAAAFLDSAVAIAVAAVYTVLAGFTVFALWRVGREFRSVEMWNPKRRRLRLEALPVGEQVAIATGEVRRKAIGAPRRVVATVVSRTDEPSVGLRP